MSRPLCNAPAPATRYFTPAQYPPAGTAVEVEGKEIPRIFRPLQIRGVTFHNRIWVAPMFQSSAQDGKVTAWHMAHLGGLLLRGPGLTITEATAVLPEGRITPEDAGIWNDEQMDAWHEIVQFAHSQNQKIAIQLAHAGRKASAIAPWVHLGHAAPGYAGGWPHGVVAPSAMPYDDLLVQPTEMTKEDIQTVIAAFVAAARRAVRAGFDVMEIHAADGYLLAEFLSPATNQRKDEYGGSFENQTRLLMEVVDAVRATIPPTMPLFVRAPATDWLEEALPDEPSWRIEDMLQLSDLLATCGVDLVDITSGGNHPKQKIAGIPGHQSNFSAEIKQHAQGKLLVSAGGLIHTAARAEDILASDEADVILVGRGFQKNPGLVWTWAEELGATITVARQIEWGWFGRGHIARRPERA